MTKARIRSCFVAVAAMLATGCAATRSPPPAMAPAPGPRGAFVAVYQDGAGALRRLDGRTGTDSVLAVQRGPVAVAATDHNRRVALGYGGTDSARVLVVDLEAGAVRRVHAAGKAYRYSLAWSADGSSLAVGYYTERRAGGLTLPDRGDIVVVPLNGAARRVGCSVSRAVLRWLPNGRLIVGDGRNWYVVNAADCRTLATVRAEGRRALTFSHDGARVAYLATAQVRRGRRAVTVTELHVANGDGTGDRAVIGEGYDPQRPRWSPDGRVLAFDVAAQETAGVRHVALFDVEAQRVRFFATQSPEGLPSDTNVHWSPGGERVVHDRTLGGVAQKVVRTLVVEPGGVQVQPLVLLEGDIGTTVAWLDAAHVLVRGDTWAKAVHVESGPAVDLPHGHALLHVWPTN